MSTIERRVDHYARRQNLVNIGPPAKKWGFAFLPTRMQLLRKAIFQWVGDCGCCCLGFLQGVSIACYADALS